MNFKLIFELIKKNIPVYSTNDFLFVRVQEEENNAALIFRKEDGLIENSRLEMVYHISGSVIYKEGLPVIEREEQRSAEKEGFSFISPSELERQMREEVLHLLYEKAENFLKKKKKERRMLRYSGEKEKLLQKNFLEAYFTSLSSEKPLDEKEVLSYARPYFSVLLSQKKDYFYKGSRMILEGFDREIKKMPSETLQELACQIQEIKKGLSAIEENQPYAHMIAPQEAIRQWKEVREIWESMKGKKWEASAEFFSEDLPSLLSSEKQKAIVSFPSKFLLQIIHFLEGKGEGDVLSCLYQAERTTSSDKKIRNIKKIFIKDKERGEEKIYIPDFSYLK